MSRDLFFFFSSRRRHTRLQGDWSSDVCSSDLTNPALRKNVRHGLGDFVSAAANGTLPAVTFLKPGDNDGHPGYSTMYAYENRSEERRVGKECRSRWSPYH